MRVQPDFKLVQVNCNMIIFSSIPTSSSKFHHRFQELSDFPNRIRPALSSGMYVPVYLHFPLSEQCIKISALFQKSDHSVDSSSLFVPMHFSILKSRNIPLHSVAVELRPMPFEFSLYRVSVEVFWFHVYYQIVTTI